MIFLGDDWAEAHHDIYLCDEAGTRLAARRLPEGIEGVTALHELVGTHCDDPAGVAVGIETDRGLWGPSTWCRCSACSSTKSARRPRPRPWRPNRSSMEDPECPTARSPSSAPWSCSPWHRPAPTTTQAPAMLPAPERSPSRAPTTLASSLPTEADSGALVFSVTNDGSKATEFYLLGSDGADVVGEVENIGPGLTRDLTVQAEKGTYTTVCKPGMVGDGIRAPFTVADPAKD